MAKGMSDFHRGEARRAEAQAARLLRRGGRESCGAALDNLVDAAQMVGAARAHLGSAGSMDDSGLSYQEREAAMRLGDALAERRKAVARACLVRGGIFSRED